MTLETNKIYNEDCIGERGMVMIGDGSVDMVLCDLPYGITRSRDTWDKVLPVDKLWEQYKRIVKPTGAIVLTAVNPFASLLITSNLPMFKYEWVWEKEQGSNFATVNYQPFRVHELALVFSNGKITYTPKGGYMDYNPQFTEGKAYSRKRDDNMGGIYASNNTYKHPSGTYDGNRHPSSIQKFNRERGLHPTQKPVALGEYLIRTYTNEGDVVLDNTCGVGSFPVAAVNTGRNFIGFELDKGYYDIAVNRVAEAMRNVG